MQEIGLMADPRITKIAVHEYEYTVNDLGMDGSGFNIVYVPGGTITRKGYIIRIFSDLGVTGEFAGGHAAEYSTLPSFAQYLIGRNALERERIYTDVKRALRKVARIGIAPVDVALWDLAGKYYNTPIYKLLGGYKESLPCYASTYHGDTHGGLSTPQAYADFAQQCSDMGYPAFKIHGWSNAPLSQEIATVHAVRRQVGNKMDLMLDPACEFTTFGDALKVGWACDEERFFWYEDPYRDGGISQFGHRKLRELIKTPLLMTEYVRSLEPHIDFVLAGATDFIRGDVRYDGITGVMKLAHACEALGIDIEFHAPGPAQRQCMAAVRNTNYYEMALVHPKAPSSYDLPIYGDGYRDALEAIDASGHVPVPQGAGLGAKIDWDWVSRHQTAVVEYE
jgi:L-alanine-DL-glutamate epimerase-like enolase superfamily enzyme